MKARDLDFSQMSDEELEKIINSADKQSSMKKYFNNVSDEELENILRETGQQIPEKIPEQESFITKLPRNLTAGVLEAGRGILNIPHQLKNLTGGHLFTEAPYFEPTNFRELVGLHEEPTIADKLAEALGEFAPALIAPEASLGKVGGAIEKIPKLGKFIKKSLQNALYPSAYVATQSEENPLKEAGISAATSVPFTAIAEGIAAKNPLLRALARAGLSTVGGGAGYYGAKALGLPESAQYAAGAGGAALGLTGKNPEINAQRKILEGIKGTNYADKLKAAERLGLEYLTPAEAAGNPFLGAMQGATGKTEAGSKLLYERGQGRIESEKNAIKNLFDQIHKEETNPEIASLYENAYKATVPEKELQALSENEIFKRAKKLVEAKPVYKESLKGIPENSIAYLDNIKKSIDDMIGKATKSGENNEARLLKQTQDKLLETMDKVAPDYKKGRSLAERKITREKIENALNEDQIKGTDFFRRILQNDTKFEKLMHSLRNVPNAQSTLKDMKLVFKDLINPPSVRTAAGFTKAGMNQERNSKKAVLEQFKQFFSNGKNDTAIVELLTNLKWQKELEKVNELTNFESKLKNMFGLLGKVGSVSAASETKPLEIEMNYPKR